MYSGPVCSLTLESRPLRMIQLFILALAFVASSNAADCEYKGASYAQGAQWEDGCTTCNCVFALTNLTACYGRCATFTHVSPTCQQTTQDPETCDCPTVSCPASQCTYNGATYSQGATWTDACLTCTCLDASNNNSYCYDQCLSYTDYSPDCQLIAQDPNTCQCPGLTCTPNGPYSECTYKGATYEEGADWTDACILCKCLNASFNISYCVDPCAKYSEYPSDCQVSTQDPNTCECPTLSCNPIGPYSECTYSGAAYQQGATWTHSCLSCTCTDAANNISHCYDPCVQKSNYPANCELSTQDPETCDCPEVTCSNTNVCTYKGETHQQGDFWNDPDNACYNCTCFDAVSDSSYCVDQCAKYEYVPSHCSIDMTSCCGVFNTANCDPTHCVYGGNAYLPGAEFNISCYECNCSEEYTISCIVPPGCEL